MRIQFLSGQKNVITLLHAAKGIHPLAILIIINISSLANPISPVNDQAVPAVWIEATWFKMEDGLGLIALKPAFRSRLSCTKLGN